MCAHRHLGNHYSVMNRLMLRFRPIAPKPAAGEERRNGAVRRTKRKYVRVRGRQTTKTKPLPTEEKEDRSKSGGVDDAERSEVTLQLLPSLRSDESERSFCYSSSAPKYQDIKIDPDPDPDQDQHRLGDEEVSCKSDVAGVATCIVVECVTDTYVDGGVGLGFSDEEIINNLLADTCPGFVSDGANNVVWVNDAYKRMAAAESGVLVRLVVRQELPYFTPSFACRVRMVQQTKQGHKRNRIVVCDVWRRMEFAGFAWKLDVQTAIGLGV